MTIEWYSAGCADEADFYGVAAANCRCRATPRHSPG